MQIVDHRDGSHRPFSVCCRCVEFDLSDSDAVLAIRKYEEIAPFPRHWSDAEIYKRTLIGVVGRQWRTTNEPRNCVQRQSRWSDPNKDIQSQRDQVEKQLRAW